MQHIILGAGEVGSAVGAVLSACDTSAQVIFHDPLHNPPILVGEDFEGWGDCVMHVCFPYSDKFVDQVHEYDRRFLCDVVVIHSTVKVGTTDKIDARRVVYSPIRGRHPNLTNDIMKFVKYYACISREAEHIFLKAFRGLTVKKFPDFRSLEAAKILCTSYYGYCLAWMRNVKKYCELNKLDFNAVYTEWNHTYNSGYNDLNLWRPTYEYMPGPIGGHCIMANLDLLEVPELVDIVKSSSADPFHSEG